MRYDLLIPNFCLFMSLGKTLVYFELVVEGEYKDTIPNTLKMLLTSYSLFSILSVPVMLVSLFC